MREHRRHAADHGASYRAAQSHAPSPAGAAPRVLILGGSSDGFAAAELFVQRGYDVVTSFAGVTETRRSPAGLARVGGFGGVTGLAAYIAVEDFALVVDATHPFAGQMKRHASQACREAGAHLVHVVRPAWRPEPGDQWISAKDLKVAAALTPRTEGPCFLTVGRTKMAHFSGRKDLRFVIRTVESPNPPFDHPNVVLIQDRGPFSLENERALFDEHGFECLVTANSGGPAAQAKLVAARERGVPVVVVERPPTPEGVVVETVEQALAAALDLIGDPAT